MPGAPADPGRSRRRRHHPGKWRRAGRKPAGVRVASRAGPEGHSRGWAEPGSSLSVSSPSPSSAAAASGCSLGPRGAARALRPSVVLRPQLLPATGSRGGGGCAGGRWPRGFPRWPPRCCAWAGCGCGCEARHRLRL